MKKKKKIAAGVAAAVAAASIAANLAFDPNELLHDAKDLDSRTRMIQTAELADLDVEYTEEEDLSRQDQMRSWFIRLPVPVKAVFLFPLWLLGAIPVAIGTAAFSSFSPLWAHLLSFVLNAGILFGLFCLVYKVLFPDRKISELFKNKKNRRWILLGVVGVTGLDLVLAQFLPGWPVLRIVVLAGGGFAVLCVLWKRICGKFRPPEKNIIHTRLKLAYE